MIKLNKQIIDLAKKSYLSDHAVLLCSMGVDSLAMTHFLLSNRKKHFSTLVPLHFNHSLREENHLMEESYKKFISDKFPNIASITIKNPDPSLKTEDDFRKFRTKSLKHVSGCVVITAHHLNDFVESYLLNTIRGNPEYLPMPFVTRHENEEVVSCKPFCFTKKKDFIDYAEKHDLMKYVVEDSTNKIVKGSRRNLIRNEIIPILDRENVGLEKIVSKRMKERLMLEILK
jgi:tRNA(Ile)-lysidine synthetase-like protein